MEFELLCGDITKSTADAIVNSLGIDGRVYGKVCEAIINASKSSELKSFIDAKTNNAPQEIFVTDSYNLPCKQIIHIVAPFKHLDDKKFTNLKKAYLNSINKAIELKCKSVAIPFIGTGANGYSRGDVFTAATSLITENYGSKKLPIKIYLIVYDNSLKNINSPIISNIDRNRTPFYPKQKDPNLVNMLRINELAFKYFKESDMFDPKCEIIYPVEFAMLIKENNDLPKGYLCTSAFDSFQISRFKKGRYMSKMDVFKLAIVVKMNPTEFLQFMTYAGYSFDSRSKIDRQFFTYIKNGRLPNDLFQLALDIPEYTSQIFDRKVK